MPWAWFLCAATSPHPISANLGDVPCLGSQEGAGGDPSGSSEPAGPSCCAGLDFSRAVCYKSDRFSRL